jgi:hypothetical protein
VAPRVQEGELWMSIKLFSMKNQEIEMRAYEIIVKTVAVNITSSNESFVAVYVGGCGR